MRKDMAAIDPRREEILRVEMTQATLDLLLHSVGARAGLNAESTMVLNTSIRIVPDGTIPARKDRLGFRLVTCPRDQPWL